MPNLVDRFFYQETASDEESDKTILRNLQVLFPEVTKIDANRLQGHLKSFHHTLASVEVEFGELVHEFHQMSSTSNSDQVVFKTSSEIGVVKWENHAVRFIVANAPLKYDELPLIFRSSNYTNEQLNIAESHKMHIWMEYCGSEESHLEKYVALLIVAGAMKNFGATDIVNCKAYVSCLAERFPFAVEGVDPLQVLRTMSPFIIYCGFTIYAAGDAEDPEGIWTRTFGANLIGQPDLACVAGSTQDAQSLFPIFENLLAESLQTGKRLMNGKTLQLTPDLVLRFTKLSEADRESLDVTDFAKSGSICCWLNGPKENPGRNRSSPQSR